MSVKIEPGGGKLYDQHCTIAVHIFLSPISQVETGGAKEDLNIADVTDSEENTRIIGIKDIK